MFIFSGDLIPIEFKDGNTQIYNCRNNNQAHEVHYVALRCDCVTHHQMVSIYRRVDGDIEDLILHVLSGRDAATLTSPIVL